MSSWLLRNLFTFVTWGLKAHTFKNRLKYSWDRHRRTRIHDLLQCILKIKCHFLYVFFLPSFCGHRHCYVCKAELRKAFYACVFKEITLVGLNQCNYFENATACSKRTLKTAVAIQLKRNMRRQHCNVWRHVLTF